MRLGVYDEGCVGAWEMVNLDCCLTQLASTSWEERIRDFQYPNHTSESVVHYAKKTAEAGLDGICSAHRSSSDEWISFVWHLVSVQQEQQLVTKTCHDTWVHQKLVQLHIVGRQLHKLIVPVASHLSKPNGTVNKLSKDLFHRKNRWNWVIIKNENALRRIILWH